MFDFSARPSFRAYHVWAYIRHHGLALKSFVVPVFRRTLTEMLFFVQ